MATHFSALLANRVFHGAWTIPYWHDDIGAHFGAVMADVDALPLGRRIYVTHAEAFEPPALWATPSASSR